MTIYSNLIAMGYTDEQIRASRRASTREFTVAVTDTPDGDPLVGIAYSCDFRAEEEWGVAELRAAFTGAKNQWQMTKATAAHATRFDDLAHSLILSTREITEPRLWGRDLKMGPGQWDAVTRGSRDSKQPYAENYDVYWAGSLSSAQGRPASWSLPWKTVPELRQMAADGGIKKLPRLKADLISAIEKLGKAETPDVWPGWFHYGDTLILRADTGITGHVLDLLHLATRRGTLAFGGGTQVFGSGLAIYDGADVGPKLKKERKEQEQWIAKHTKALEPVKKELTRRGFKWYALGRPSEINGEVKYWLNGSGHPQPYGWYTLSELLAEKFVADIKAKNK